nr:hypothetical protein CFP56_21025 [Quercus suber]
MLQPLNFFHFSPRESFLLSRSTCSRELIWTRMLCPTENFFVRSCGSLFPEDCSNLSTRPGLDGTDDHTIVLVEVFSRGMQSRLVAINSMSSASRVSHSAFQDSKKRFSQATQRRSLMNNL